MVHLTKIYTRTGDAGATALGDGRRVRKTSARVEAYGAVDEANAALGVAIVALRSADTASDEHAAWNEIAGILESIQHDLFDCGADLCTPAAEDEQPGSRLRITPEQTERLERLIDRFNERLAPLNSFVLPGGSAPAAALHVARTVVRRAERLAFRLAEEEETATPAEPLRYLNRLSDLLFVLSRSTNREGAGDVLWKPGANRGRAEDGGRRPA